MSEVAHFYHAWADGNWRAPAEEHVSALASAGFDGEVYLGIVGSPVSRDEARSWFRRRLGKSAVVAEADQGFEQVTLQALHARAKEHDGAVLYAHTKGSYHADVQQDLWRQSMTYHLVTRWRDRVADLADHDAVGCHWWVPGAGDWDIPVPVFAGNFWWATSAYISTLPPVGQGSRHDAEFWLGAGNPRVKALCGPELTIKNFGFRWNYFEKRWIREFS